MEAARRSVANGGRRSPIRSGPRRIPALAIERLAGTRAVGPNTDEARVAAGCNRRVSATAPLRPGESGLPSISGFGAGNRWRARGGRRQLLTRAKGIAV